MDGGGLGRVGEGGGHVSRQVVAESGPLYMASGWVRRMEE